MAYLHCHTKGCNWSQDDFWDWKWEGVFRFWRWKHRPFGYNPFSLILEDITEYWFPRFVEFDLYAAKEMGFKTKRIHSWRMLIYNVRRHFRRFFITKWKTWEGWKKARDTAVCPKCGRRNFDID
jgi:hypothetical protein